MKGDIEEIALSLKGKRNQLTLKTLINYFGNERCSLNNIIIEKTLDSIKSAMPVWNNLIDISFLSDEMKEKYLDLLARRIKILEFN